MRGAVGFFCLHQTLDPIRQVIVEFYFQYAVDPGFPYSDPAIMEERGYLRAGVHIKIQRDAGVPGSIGEGFPFVGDDHFWFHALAFALRIKFLEQRMVGISQTVIFFLDELVGHFFRDAGALFVTDCSVLDFFFQADKGSVIVVITDPKFFAVAAAVLFVPISIVINRVKIETSDAVAVAY